MINDGQTINFLLGIFLIVIAVFLFLTAKPFKQKRGIDNRLGKVSRYYLNPSSYQIEEEDGEIQSESISSSLVSIIQYLAGFIGTLNLANPKEQAKIRALLLKSGIRRPDGLRLFMVVKLIFMILGAIMGVFAIFTTSFVDYGLFAIILAGAVAGFVSGLSVEIVLGQIAAKRQKSIVNTLPDALDLLIICANAGYSLDLAILRVGKELRRSAPAIADELLATSDELKVMSDRRQALENFATRTDQPSTKSFVATLVQAQKYGTPLTQALRTLATELRAFKMLAMEEDAAKLPVKITIPLMVLILPALFIVILTPAIISVSKSWPQ